MARPKRTSGGSGRTILGMLETTPATPSRRSEAFVSIDSPAPDVAFDWEPRPLARAIRSGRRFRWPVLIITVIIAAAAYAGVFFGLRYPDAHVRQRSAEYAVAAGTTAAALDQASAAAATITDAGAPVSELTGSIGSLLRLETSAARLDSVAAGWLLDLPDPIPAPALDDLVAARSRLRAVAATADDITGRLRTVTDYRLGIQGLLRLPSLPTPANPIPAVDAQRSIGEMLAAAVTRLGSLPDDPALAVHRDRLAELVMWLGQWQSRYVAVLQVGDLETAVAMEREAQGRIADAHLELLAPLAEIGVWAEDSIGSLRRHLEEAVILAGR